MAETKKYRLEAAQEEEMGIDINEGSEHIPSYAKENSGQQLETYIDDIAADPLRPD